MPTENKEFFDPMADDSGFEWERAEGYPEGVYEMILYEDDDGSHSRFLKLEPGAETEEVLTHEFYEEAYVIQGGLYDKTLDEAFTAGMYACRTPEMEHGPYSAPVGALTFEVRYFKD
jgi:anti-sigma factor ChrR (cupin superfamily)